MIRCRATIRIGQASFNPANDQIDLFGRKWAAEERHSGQAFASQAADQLAVYRIARHQNCAFFASRNGSFIAVQAQPARGALFRVAHDTAFGKYCAHRCPVRWLCERRGRRSCRDRNEQQGYKSESEYTRHFYRQQSSTRKLTRDGRRDASRASRLYHVFQFRAYAVSRRFDTC